jgi:hypothetical protein
MDYTEDFLKKIVNLGTLGYDVEQAINILDIEDKDINSFTNDWNNHSSVVSRSYKKGVDKADYAIDLKLFKLATEGDLKALQKYEERKSYQKLKGKR